MGLCRATADHGGSGGDDVIRDLVVHPAGAAMVMAWPGPSCGYRQLNRRGLTSFMGSRTPGWLCRSLQIILLIILIDKLNSHETGSGIGALPPGRGQAGTGKKPGQGQGPAAGQGQGPAAGQGHGPAAGCRPVRWQDRRFRPAGWGEGSRPPEARPEAGPGVVAAGRG